MAKGIYIGVNGVARKARKIYIGVNGVARKIKKIYVGVNGIARLAYGAEPSYAGTTTPLSSQRVFLGGASIGGYALFACGTISTSNTNVVESYSSSLVKGTAPIYGQAVHHIEGTKNLSYALFAGGQNYNNSTYYNSVRAYSTTLAAVSPQQLYNEGVVGHGAASIGDQAIFAGGFRNTTTNSKNARYTAYDSTLTWNGQSTAFRARGSMGSASNSSYAVFAGGYDSNGDVSDYVDAYNSSLIRVLTNISSARGLYGAGNPNYAIFIGINGFAEAFDNNMVRHSAPTPTGNLGYDMAGTSVGEFAIIAGGFLNYTTASDKAYIYDKNLTLSISQLSQAKGQLAAATAGNHALFAGGQMISGRSDIVDVFSI